MPPGRELKLANHRKPLLKMEYPLVFATVVNGWSHLSANKVTQGRVWILFLYNNTLCESLSNSHLLNVGVNKDVDTNNQIEQVSQIAKDLWIFTRYIPCQGPLGNGPTEDQTSHAHRSPFLQALQFTAYCSCTSLKPSSQSVLRIEARTHNVYYVHFQQNFFFVRTQHKENFI